MTSPRLYLNARVLTPEPSPWTGLRVAGGLITHLFNAPGDLDGDPVDLEGATIVPGLVDAHVHLRAIGEFARLVDLREARSADEAALSVAEAARNQPPGAWIRGRGWDQNLWSDRSFPDAAQLDARCADHPVWLSRVDGHAAWLNSAALDLVLPDPLAPAPPGGQILRDADGRPTGLLIDNAISSARERLPVPTDAEVAGDLRWAIARCHAQGLTGVHAMGVDAAELRGLRRLQRGGELGLRVVAYLSDEDDELPCPGPTDEGLLTIPGVKLYADGALGSRGAALLAPYDDAPDSAGLLLREPDALRARCAVLHAAGWQVAVHAIGDRANRVVLDALEAAQGSDRTRRHRVEHAQLLHDDDLPRFAAGGIIPSLQPTHTTSDMRWLRSRLGAERLARVSPLRRLLDSGAVLPFSSDAPIEPLDPRRGLHAAATRTDKAGWPDGGWQPQELITRQEALRGFTSSAAWAAHLEARTGRVAVGLAADLTILSGDPLDPAVELSDLEVRGVVVGGRAVSGPN